MDTTKEWIGFMNAIQKNDSSSCVLIENQRILCHWRTSCWRTATFFNSFLQKTKIFHATSHCIQITVLCYLNPLRSLLLKTISLTHRISSAPLFSNRQGVHDSLMVSVLEVNREVGGSDPRQGRNLPKDFCFTCSLAKSTILSTLNVLYQWRDETARERIGHRPS